jgi:hypothetical protein
MLHRRARHGTFDHGNDYFQAEVNVFGSGIELKGWKNLRSAIFWHWILAIQRSQSGESYNFRLTNVHSGERGWIRTSDPRLKRALCNRETL